MQIGAKRFAPTIVVANVLASSSSSMESLQELLVLEMVDSGGSNSNIPNHYGFASG